MYPKAKVDIPIKKRPKPSKFGCPYFSIRPVTHGEQTISAIEKEANTIPT